MSDRIDDGGMTLRDWFAGMALQGLLGNKDYAPAFNSEKDAHIAATDAYGFADAMLKAKAKHGGD